MHFIVIGHDKNLIHTCLSFRSYMFIITLSIFYTGIAFRRWIEYKIETDAFWQNGAEVVFSGPGM